MRGENRGDFAQRVMVRGIADKKMHAATLVE